MQTIGGLKLSSSCLFLTLLVCAIWAQPLQRDNDNDQVGQGETDSTELDYTKSDGEFDEEAENHQMELYDALLERMFEQQLRKAMETEDFKVEVNKAVTRAVPAKPVDLSFIMDVIPIKKIRAIVKSYICNDEDVRNAFKFLLSNQFIRMETRLKQLPEVKALLDYLSAYINMDKLKDDDLEKSVHSSAATSQAARKDLCANVPTTKKQPSGMNGLVQSILDELARSDMKAMLVEKIITEEDDLSALVDMYNNPEFAQIIRKLLKSRGVNHFILNLNEHGINLLQILTDIEGHIGTIDL